ncbi:MAG: hypothetical protein WD424_11200 [Paenibacillaceae bacterium]
MKVNRLLALILIFTLLGVATVFADTIYEKYTAKKVTIKVNGTTLDSFGLEVDISKTEAGIETKTMVPLDELVNSIGGIVSVDDKGINIYKPNVQLSAVSPKDLKSIRVVEKGKNDIKVPIKVFAFMDSILTDISYFKITVLDPFGNEIESSIEPLAKEDQGSEVFQYTSNTLEVNMKWTGKYTVNLHMKEVGGSKYYKVGQIAIYSVSK